MKLHTKVIPNPYNDSGFVIIICKRWLGFDFEIGRAIDEHGFDEFMRAYNRFDGQEFVKKEAK